MSESRTCTRARNNWRYSLQPERAAILFSLLLFLTTIPAIRSEICTLCPNATHEPLAGDSASFILTDGTYLSCTKASELAPEGIFSNCTALHNRVAEICECGDPSTSNDPFQCPLCGEGQTLPLPDRMVANRTCREWEEKAANDFESDCPSYQKSFGSYCGCDIVSDPNHFEGFCRICNDALLPNPSKTVLFERIEGNQKVLYTRFCAELEQDFNSRSVLDCEKTQADYGKETVCDCGYEIDPPTRPPSSDLGTSSGEMVRMNRNFYIIGGGVLLFLEWCSEGLIF